MAKGLEFRESLSIISGGYPREGTGSDGVTQDWTETSGTSGSSTVTYYYHDSATMTDSNSTIVRVTVTDEWSAVKRSDNTYEVTVHSILNSITRERVGSPSPLSVSIFVRRERGGANIWTSGGCVNASANATHATNVDLGTYTIVLPPGQPAVMHGAIYYRSNICGYDNTNPPSIYVDEYWLGINFRNTLPPDYRPGKIRSVSGESTQIEEGTSISVQNTVDKSFTQLELKGDTKQNAYTGKNLFDKANIDILNGYFESSGDTIHSQSANRVFYIPCEPNTRYSFRQGTTTLSNHVFQIATTSETPVIGSVVSGFYEAGRNNVSGYLTASNAAYIVVRIRAGDDVSTFWDGVQIEKGSTATDYEPYVGGIPSPSPDYPQEVQTVTGEQTVTISDGGGNSQTLTLDLGRNFWSDLPESYSRTLGSCVCVTKPTGHITMNGTSSGSNNWTLDSAAAATNGVVVPLETGTYTMFTDNTTIQKQVIWTNSDGSSEGLLVDSTNSGVSFTLTETKLVYVRVRVTANTTYNEDISVEIQKGATQRTPIELCKIGTYQDYIYQSGASWFLHKEIGSGVLSSTGTSWYRQGIAHPNGFTATLTDVWDGGDAILTTSVPKLSSHYTYQETAWTGGNGAFGITTTGVLWLVHTSDLSLADFKTWLENNNVKLYAPLDSATDREILDPTLIAQLDALKARGSYSGQTAITVTGDLAAPLKVGIRVYSGTPTWSSHNRDGGWAGVWDGSTFKEMRTEGGPDATGNPPTIFRNDFVWHNQRKIGQE